jgi:hypothetical protein
MTIKYLNIKLVGKRGGEEEGEVKGKAEKC